MPARPRHLALAAAVLGQAMGLGGLAAGQTVVVLPGTANTGITGISDDGTHVVGGRNGIGPYFWNAADGFVDLNRPVQNQSPVPMLSGDGVTMVAVSGEFATRSRTILATATGGVTVLPFSATGVNHSNPYGVSRDGSVVVGWDSSSTSSLQVGWRWSASGGMQALPFPVATAVSGDGNTALGLYNSNQGIVWRNGVSTPLLGSAFLSATNYDGSIICGSNSLGLAMWRGNQVTQVPYLPAGSSGTIVEISDDGSVAVGTNYVGNGVQAPFIWTAAGGTRELGSYFASLGIDLSPYRVYEAHVSADGRTFGLSGESVLDHSTRGVIVTIPCPATLGPLIALLAAGRRRR